MRLSEARIVRNSLAYRFALLGRAFRRFLRAVMGALVKGKK